MPQKANSDGSVCFLPQSHCSNGPESGKLTLSSVLPDCTADCAVYNRLMYLTQEHMRQLFAHDREVLQQFRQLCLPAPSNINNLNKTNTTISNTTDSNFPPLGGNVWAAKSTTNSANKPPPNNTSSSIKPISPVGDVEALPFIQLALERQQQLEKEFESKLTQKALVNSLMMDAPVRSSSNQDPFTSTNKVSDTMENAIANKLHYHIYQHAAGSLVFMHPICAKCILETSVHAGIESNTGENDSAQRLSPRTQLQKKLAPHSSAKPTPVNTTGEISTPSVNFTTAGFDTTPADDASPRTPSTPITANTTTTLPLNLHSTLRARVIDAECVRVTTDTRARYNVLRHLPLHSEVMLLEIDLAGIVPQHILCKYSEELNKRALRRKERAKQEKREKRLEQDRR